MAIYNIAGVSDSRAAAVCGKIINENKGQSLVVASNFNRAQKLATDLSFFVDKKIYLLQSEDDTFTFFDAKNREPLQQRLGAMKALAMGEPCVVVAPVFAAIKKLIPKSVFLENHLDFKVDKENDINHIAEKLTGMGYERVSMVYGKGQFSLRGSILDIFTPYDENPFRIEFFDTEVESIRTFDVDTQRSIKKIKEVNIYPAVSIVRDEEAFTRARETAEKQYANIPERRDELLDSISNMENAQQLEFYLDYFYKKPDTLIDYLDEQLVMIDDPVRVQEAVETRTIEYNVDFKEMLRKGKVVKGDYENFPMVLDYQNLYLKDKVYLCTPFVKKVDGVEKYEKITTLKTMEPLDFNGQMDIFGKEIRKYVKNKYKVVIACSTEDRKENIKDFLSREKLIDHVTIKNGTLSRGMEFIDEKYIIISDRDIFGTQKKKTKKPKKYKNAKPIKAFTEIKPGDFVVHENHGVGKYVGIKQMEIQGIKKDYMHIKYAGDDVLYVPVEQMSLIQRYVGSESVTPKIYKLSGTEWKKTKAKAKGAIAEMAKELIELSASRKADPGHAFAKDTPWQKEFEDSFPYAETQDQLRCIEEIKRDMEKPEAMDRLLCGDVGYGKTEVAARAMFKCAMEGKQVAVLVPTTILANQHYNTLKARFEKFPFKVEMMSRFRTPQQQKLIAEEVKKGRIDVIIGTHRLLSDDIKFKDLGLLVIDEEQRFGVAHKEKIKQLRKNIDVLTLSATPIPRTLHMSLVGIRDMSVIEEPPQERIPVQTYVMEEDDYIIREAIERETGRGGQVFIIYNKVRGIQRLANRIQSLVPDKKVIIGHGQMGEHRLEEVMMEFINGEADVLIATTIIETGIDIPNANTEIIIDADKFGLSQLYQLRGRVGRSTKLAYAYLMHKKEKVLTEVAEKRLRAIKEFTEFGAGFKIAMRDLEIRGAGNLLGTEQHGHMISVGYELYCKMVDEAVAALKGEVIKDEREEVVFDVKIPAFIPDTYIKDEVSKLNVYKQIASVENLEEGKELIEELEDRFGNMPEEVRNLVSVAVARNFAEEMGIKKIKDKGDQIFFIYEDKSQKPFAIYKRAGIPVLEDIADFLHTMATGKKS